MEPSLNRPRTQPGKDALKITQRLETPYLGLLGLHQEIVSETSPSRAGNQHPSFNSENVEYRVALAVKKIFDLQTAKLYEANKLNDLGLVRYQNRDDQLAAAELSVIKNIFENRYLIPLFDNAIDVNATGFSSRLVDHLREGFITREDEFISFIDVIRGIGSFIAEHELTEEEEIQSLEFIKLAIDTESEFIENYDLNAFTFTEIFTLAVASTPFFLNEVKIAKRSQVEDVFNFFNHMNLVIQTSLFECRSPLIDTVCELMTSATFSKAGFNRYDKDTRRFVINDVFPIALAHGIFKVDHYQHYPQTIEILNRIHEFSNLDDSYQILVPLKEYLQHIAAKFFILEFSDTIAETEIDTEALTDFEMLDTFIRAQIEKLENDQLDSVVLNTDMDGINVVFFQPLSDGYNIYIKFKNVLDGKQISKRFLITMYRNEKDELKMQPYFLKYKEPRLTLDEMNHTLMFVNNVLTKAMRNNLKEHVQQENTQRQIMESRRPTNNRQKARKQVSNKDSNWRQKSSSNTPLTPIQKAMLERNQVDSYNNNQWVINIDLGAVPQQYYDKILDLIDGLTSQKDSIYKHQLYPKAGGKFLAYGIDGRVRVLFRVEENGSITYVDTFTSHRKYERFLDRNK